MTSAAKDVNREQVDYWNGEAGARWVKSQEAIDTLLQPITAAALRAAAVAPGMDVVEIGCGCGSTTVALAGQVGASGSVLAVDVSEPMLGQARRRLTTAAARVVLELADASTFAFTPGSADLVFSRFGVMFFSDPVTAFANIRTALRPGGRLAFACWQPVADNPWVVVPMGAALAHLPAPEPPEPGAPGPFQLGDPERVRAILTDAGFHQVSLEDFRCPLLIRGDLDDVVGFYQEIGPLSRWFREVEPAVVQRALGAVRDTLREHLDDDGIRFGSASWIVSATV